MKKLFLLSLPIVFFMTGCTNDFEDQVLPIKGEVTLQVLPIKGEVTLQVLPIKGEVTLIEETPPYYDVESGMWLQPIDDPYTLDNFQRAYDNLSTHASPFSGQLASALPATTLLPTHYHLKIKPRSEVELERFSAMEDVVIGYFPFNTDMIPEETIEKLKLSDVKTVSTIGNSEVRYYGEQGEYLDDEGNWVLDEPYMLPIIYAIWPCEKPLPEDSDYERTYDIFLPKAAAKLNMSTPSLVILEKEALGQANWEIKDPGFDIFIPPAGTVVSYDLEVGKNVPLANLKVRIKDGSNVYDTYTDNNGKYGFKVTYLSPGARVYFLYEYLNTWIITDKNNTLFTVPSSNWAGFFAQDITSFESDIHHAANFWFRGNHELTKTVKPNGGRIKIHGKGSNSSANGMFFSSANYPYIHIYDNSRASNGVICTVFHELGHASQYNQWSYSKYKHIDVMIRESWGRFTGWYGEEMYYRSLGSIPSRSLYGAANAQEWTVKISGSARRYSPLFIDLRDNYNQREEKRWRSDYMDYPNDNIRNVHVFLIEWIAFKSTGITTFQKNAKTLIGFYYTEKQYNDYFEIYKRNWQY